MRRGTRLGVDVGKARIGVARCDPDGFVATPVETVPRDRSADGTAHVRRIAELARDEDLFGFSGPLEIVVGLPLSLSGASTPSTDDARSVARAIGLATGLPVRLVDERLTTVSATRQLRDVGRRASRSRDRIDQVAAVVILQSAIDAERSSGRAPGALLELDAADDDSSPAGAEADAEG